MTEPAKAAKPRTLLVEGVTLHLSRPMTAVQEWIGDREILKQLLACWLVIDEKDLPFFLHAASPPAPV